MAAYCYTQSSVVGLCVGHVGEPGENGCADRHAVWDSDSGGPSNHVLDGARSPNRKGEKWRLAVKHRDILQ